MNKYQSLILLCHIYFTWCVIISIFETSLGNSEHGWMVPYSSNSSSVPQCLAMDLIAARKISALKKCKDISPHMSPFVK